MKKLHTLILALMLSISTFAQIPTNGLIAWYPFSGNANDASGNSNNGTVNGATLITDRFGNANSAYYFDGSAIITVADAPSLNIQQPNGQITVSVWAYKTGSQIDGHLIGKRGTSYQYQLAFNFPTYGIGWGGAGAYLENILYTFPINVWIHYVGTFDGSVWKLYKDGLLVGSLTALLPAPVSDVLIIGGSGNNTKFVGNLDDIRIYNRALTTAEVTELYNESQTISSCNFIPNTSSWLGNSDMANGANIIDNNYSSFTSMAMSNYSTVYTKYSEINFSAPKAISAFKFKYSFPSTTGANSCTWPSSGNINNTCKVNLYYKNGSNWIAAYSATNLNTLSPVGICEHIDSAQINFLDSIIATNWKVEMVGNYWLGGAYQTTTYFKLFEIGFKECPTCTTSMPHSNDTVLCGGGVTTLTATGGTNYFWYDLPTGGSQIASGASYTTPFLMTTTTYYVSNWDGICESTRDTVVVTINLLPTVAINPVASFVNINASPVNLSGIPAGGAFLGTGVSGNEFNPSVAGLGMKYINYSFTDSNNCTNSASESIIVYDTTGIICTDTIHISVTDTLIINAVLTAINPPNNINTLKIYPNPAYTHIYIYCGNYSSMNGYTIRIDNSLAQSVFTTPVAQQQYYVDLSGWSGTGTYFVYIIDDLSNIIEIRKIILQ